MKLGRQVGLGPGHIVLDGDPALPSPKEAQPPIFGPCLFRLYCDQTVGWMKMKLGKQVGLVPSQIVLYGDPNIKGHSPQFFVHICCGQMAAWIKMLLGMELGLGPGDFVLDGDPGPPCPPQTGGGAPPQIFGPCLW